jgi:acyl-CoA synthetase (AMP-forming)/AMP-acid ligase II
MALMHTSATTGRPKAVVLSHRSLMHVSLGWLSCANPGPDAVLLNCCPLYHGSFGTSITYLAAGGTVVVMRGFTPQRFLRAVPEHRVTHVWAVPEMLAFLLRTAATERTDLSSLREVIYGAAPMPIELYRRAALALGCGFRQVYGMTELGGSLATLAPHEHPDPRETTIDVIPTGRPVLGMSVRVKDAEGADVPVGEVGELCVRGDDLMRGYWRDPGASAQIMRDGWLRTGDLGRIDERGLIWITDRLKDVVIRGGQNVYPAEIERVLRTHPAVADAAVVAVPDPDWGQSPLAFVVRDPAAALDEDELTEELFLLLTEKLAAYKRPCAIRYTAGFPRTPSGKVLKRELREQAPDPEQIGASR